MKKTLFILFIIAGIFSAKSVVVEGATILFPYQGGTGIGTATVGEIGDCLKVLSASPFAYELGACGTGGGGGGGFPMYIQNGGATLNTATTTLNFTANSFSITESPTDTMIIRVATTTLGILASSISDFVSTVRTSISETITGLTYTSGTGVLSLDSGYTIPTTTRAVNWDTFYTTPSNRITDGTGLTWSTNTLNCDTANGSTQGCLTSTDWVGFNGKVGSTSIDTSAELAALVTDETGVGSLVFSGSPVFTGGANFAGIRASASSTLGYASSTALTVSGNTYLVNATSSTSFFSALGTFTNLVINTLATFLNVTITGLLDIGAGVLEIPNGTAPTVDSVGELALDTTSNQLVLYGTEKKVIGNGNEYATFTYATTTAWTGTTTLPLGPAYIAETWNGIQCFTDAGTLIVQVGDGTNFTNANQSSTTVGTTNFTTNNTFTAGEKRYFRAGTPASSPTTISCTISKSLTAD